MNMFMKKMQRIHFIGIGGIGMSSIAEVLKADGFRISGSDLSSSAVTKHLVDLGCKVYKGHKAENVGDAEAVVYSSAVSIDNPEIVEARRLRIPVIRRAEMLAEIMRLREGIAIAGTHGKTTTTSLTGEILTYAGLDPTVVVGGVVRGLGTNARLGASNLLVAEADEYDRSFLKLSPSLAVITTMEAEHLDTYGDFESYREAFITFANSVPFYGRVILCCDEVNLLELKQDIDRPILTYGFNPQADIRGELVKEGCKNCFKVIVHEEELGIIQLPLAGMHNMRNALAAVAVSLELDVPFEKIKESLESFEGVKRRFEQRGEVKGIQVYDDYAHHPTEVKMTLQAARSTFDGRIIAVFQPHLFSRTEAFYTEFAHELQAADVVVITDVYPSREKPIEGVTGELVVNQAKEFGHKQVMYIPERKNIAKEIKSFVKETDVVVTLGAGDIYKTSDELLTLLEKDK